MRVQFVTWSTPGHLFPMVPLARAWQTAGHEVRVAAPESCRQAIGHAGLTAVAVGRPVDLVSLGRREDFRAWYDDDWAAGWAGRPEALTEAQEHTLRAASGRQLAVADAMLDDLLAHAAQWRPDLVVYDPLSFAGPVLAAVLGVPGTAHGWEVATVLGTELADRRAGTPLPGYLELFERYGVAARPATRRLIDPTPPSMRLPETVPVERVEMRYVPYNGPGEVPRDLTGRADIPRVCFTSGVALSKTGADAVTRTIDDMMTMTRGLTAEVVLAIGPGQRDLLPGLPEGVRVAEGVPFQLLLPHCDAVVHHGGAGTAMTAVHCRVPQLVLAQSPIYSEVGHRVAAGGAGVVLTGAERTPERAADTLAGLLRDDSYCSALTGLAAEAAAMPSPAEVVDILAAQCP
ncbi:nucleotide disphospho-sugar-binding domain-containing protein [Streptomyces sp. NPDC048417]|uniref:nucleotide disphospho-sugar-binding domain-containing protein n=1 Tax=Streptomyces sp. NPDC048417 TaxID=3155387 RepID=UPI0034340E80